MTRASVHVVGGVQARCLVAEATVAHHLQMGYAPPSRKNNLVHPSIASSMLELSLAAWGQMPQQVNVISILHPRMFALVFTASNTSFFK